MGPPRNDLADVIYKHDCIQKHDWECLHDFSTISDLSTTTANVHTFSNGVVCVLVDRLRSFASRSSLELDPVSILAKPAFGTDIRWGEVATARLQLGRCVVATDARSASHLAHNLKHRSDLR